MFATTILLSLTLAGPLNPAPTAHAKGAQAASAPIIRAQGHPLHVDFFNASSKRADLRARTASKGVDAAFTQWLQEEKPHVYEAAIGNAQISVR